MDLNKMCRLCATEDKPCVKIFGPEGEKKNIAVKLRICFPIIVNESDNFPKQICLSCLTKLDASYVLYKQCLEAKSKIKNLMMINQNKAAKVYSEEEMLKIMKAFKKKLTSKKRPAMSVQDSSQPEDSSNIEQSAKKQKDGAVAGGSGMMDPIGQRYMLLPCGSRAPTVVIPSPVPQMPQAPNVITAGPALSTIDTAVTTATVTIANNSQSTVPPQITSIQARQNSSGGPPCQSSQFPAGNTTTESASVTEPQVQQSSAQKSQTRTIVAVDDAEEEDAPVTETANKNREEGDEDTQELSSGTGEQGNHQKCPFCKKYFPENVIVLHENLHFRQTFFCCIMCNKNFPIEADLEKHSCED